jgi:hypothetical protein
LFLIVPKLEQNRNATLQWDLINGNGPCSKGSDFFLCVYSKGGVEAGLSFAERQQRLGKGSEVLPAALSIKRPACTIDDYDPHYKDCVEVGGQQQQQQQQQLQNRGIAAVPAVSASVLFLVGLSSASSCPTSPSGTNPPSPTPSTKLTPSPPLNPPSTKPHHTYGARTLVPHPPSPAQGTIGRHAKSLDLTRVHDPPGGGWSTFLPSTGAGRPRPGVSLDIPPTTHPATPTTHPAAPTTPLPSTGACRPRPGLSLDIPRGQAPTGGGELSPSTRKGRRMNQVRLNDLYYSLCHHYYSNCPP